MGSYGAVAEFFQDAGEVIDSDSSDDLIRLTPRGGIRIEPQEDTGMNNEVLTELGQDVSALSGDDRDALLFDLGVSSLGSGCFQLDFCVRTNNSDLVEFLREHCGSSIFEHGSPVFPRLLEAQPQRVVVTRLGRIEVYQAIGGEYTDDKTPEGPHTHLLPELLGLNLTHSADVPIKEGWVPCAFLYPKSPVLSEAGEAHCDS